MTETPRLWSWVLSPFAGKARVAFAEKGVEVDIVEIDPRDRPARLRELNPFGKVPTLELDGGAAIRESSVICEWLEEVHPDPPLWPSDPADRAWARAWSRFVDEVPTRGFFVGMRKMAFGKADGDPDDVVEQLHAEAASAWPRLEAALAIHDGPWLAGEQLTLADLSATALAVRLPQWKPDLLPDPGEHPRTAAWLDALRERPSAAAIEQAGTPAA